MPNKRIPINRVNKFFSEEDFTLEQQMGREAIEGDGNFVVVLYRVDREMTSSDDIYGEARKDEIRFFPPVELRVIPILASLKNQKTKRITVVFSGSLRYLQDGPLTFGIYDAQLNDLDVTLSYGDYIGYAVTEQEVRYYTVVNDGVKNYDNKHTIMGYKGAFRTVTCAPVDENEFRGF